MKSYLKLFFCIFCSCSFSNTSTASGDVGSYWFESDKLSITFYTLTGQMEERQVVNLIAKAAQELIDIYPKAPKVHLEFVHKYSKGKYFEHETFLDYLENAPENPDLYYTDKDLKKAKKNTRPQKITIKIGRTHFLLKEVLALLEQGILNSKQLAPKQKWVDQLYDYRDKISLDSLCLDSLIKLPLSSTANEIYEKPRRRILEDAYYIDGYVLRHDSLCFAAFNGKDITYFTKLIFPSVRQIFCYRYIKIIFVDNRQFYYMNRDTLKGPFVIPDTSISDYNGINFSGMRGKDEAVVFEYFCDEKNRIDFENKNFRFTKRCLFFLRNGKIVMDFDLKEHEFLNELPKDH